MGVSMPPNDRERQKIHAYQSVQESTGEDLLTLSKIMKI